VEIGVTFEHHISDPGFPGQSQQPQMGVPGPSCLAPSIVLSFNAG